MAEFYQNGTFVIGVLVFHIGLTCGIVLIRGPLKLFWLKIMISGYFIAGPKLVRFFADLLVNHQYNQTNVVQLPKLAFLPADLLPIIGFIFLFYTFSKRKQSLGG